MTEPAAAILSTSFVQSRFESLLGWWREHALADRRGLVTGLLACLASLLLALLLQILLLGGWRIGQADIRLAMSSPSGSSALVDGEGQIQWQPQQPPSIVVARNLDLNASALLALEFEAGPNPFPLQIELAWTSTRDLRRAQSQVFTIPAATSARRLVLNLRGHPAWDQRITSVALALRAQANTPAWTTGPIELRAASITGAAGLTFRHWFSKDPPLTSPEQGGRILPLIVWLALASILAIGIGHLATRRKQPVPRAATLSGILLSTFVLAALLALAQAPGSLHRAAHLLPFGWLLLALCSGTLALQLRSDRREALFWGGLCALSFMLLAAYQPRLAGISLLTMLAAALVHRHGQLLKPILPLAILLPPMLASGLAQGFLGSAAWLKQVGLHLRDPSLWLGEALMDQATLIYPVLTLALVSWLWPCPSGHPRWQPAALVGAYVALLAMLGLAATDAPPPEPSLLLWPTLLMLGLAALPALRQVAAHAAELRPQARSEADLSDQARRLFEASLGAFVEDMTQDRPGEAKRHWQRLQALAPEATATLWAELGLGIKEGRLAQVRASFEQLRMRWPLASDQHRFTLLEYAWLTRDAEALKALIPAAPTGPTRAKAAAWLALREAGPKAALAALGPEPGAEMLVLERAELCLLLDDLPGTQQALEASGIPIESIAGQCYVNRLGLRALGPAHYALKIQQQATWYPELAIAQVAMGELLLKQGDREGAAARFRHALKLDPGLWPLEYHLGFPTPVQGT